MLLPLDIRRPDAFFGNKTRKRMMLSLDGVYYAPIGNFKSIKRLFGASRGMVQIGFKAEKEKGPSASVGLALK